MTAPASAAPRPGDLEPRPGHGSRRRRVALLGLGGASLLSGLDAALVALGVWAPVPAAHLPGVHGMVMVLGFMGTLISLERAQALRQPWAYLAPALLGSGGITLAAGLPVLGQLLLVQGAVAFLAVYLALWRRAPLPLVAVQVLSTIPALAAAALWFRVDLAALIPLLAAFLVLTIAAERAELAQLALGPRAVPILLVLSAWVTGAAASALVWPDASARLLGAGLLATAAWLARDDVARRMVRTTTGLRRYNGAALLAGYAWLAVAGLVWLVGGAPGSDAAYDVVIHTTFLGFGVSMVMAHAPIIFPAVLGRPLPYRPILWLPLALLHGGLLFRVVGDALGRGALWQGGSVVTVVSLLVFAASAAWCVVRA
ncbi:hypothetical protein [Propioniciclava sp. MC1595]|uniref:hypothetical protein n=1 Tax=Propioniciclava sp. MC1595 TaxID=2760308 RepID=UPI001CB77CD2|nr:hypothetical protein [Propioniciclava sp. MC1595]